jgi:Fur family ferric uptake transcriptional regulator
VDKAEGNRTLEQWLAQVEDALVQDRQRMTKQRRLVAETLWQHRHFNVEELHRAVRERDDAIGYATTYRTVKLLERVGLVHAGQFGDGTARFEVAVGDSDHHDHLICTRCGAIVEFELEAIEALQKQVAELHGYALTAHRLDMFGLCPICQKAGKRL